MTEIFKHTTLRLEDLTYQKPEKQGNFYYSKITYGESKPVYIKTPTLRSCQDCSVLSSKNALMKLQIDGDDFGVYDFFLQLDDHNVNHTFEKSKDWFGKELPVEVIDDMYRRGTKPFEKDTNPTLEFKMPFSKDKCECVIFNKDKESVPLDEIKENTGLISIIHIKGLKFLKKEYYCDCYITQIKESELEHKVLTEPVDGSKPKSFFDECLIDDDDSGRGEEVRVEKEKKDKLEKEKKDKLEKDKLEKEKKDKLEKDKVEKERVERVEKERIGRELSIKEKEHEILSSNLDSLKKEIDEMKIKIGQA